MKKILNVSLSILLSISIFLFVFSVFGVSNRFIYNIIDDIKYEDTVYKNIKIGLKEYDDTLEYTLSKKDIRKDLNNYINKNFNLPNLKSKIKCSKSNKKIKNIYISNIRFFDDINYKLIKRILYIFTFIFIIITGNLFFKTKCKHNINIILLISGIINIILYGILFLFNNLKGIKLIIFNNVIHIVLFIACLEVFVSILFFNEDKIDKLLKRKDKIKNTCNR